MMKKKSFLILFWLLLADAFAQIAPTGESDLLIYFPAGLLAERIPTYYEWMNEFDGIEIDSIARLRIHRWHFKTAMARYRFMEKMGPDTASLDHPQLYTPSEPQKPRPHISEDTLLATATAYWRDSFLRPCQHRIGNTTVKVAIIDCGVSVGADCQPMNALLRRYYDSTGSRNFTTEISDCAVQDLHVTAHGTRVANVMAQIYESTRMDPRIQKLTSFKAFNRNGEADLWHILQAIDACIEQGIHIVNLSFNYRTVLPHGTGAVRAKLILEEAINTAKNYNILFVTAAGNDGANTDADRYTGYFPTNFNCPNLIRVAADSLGQPTHYTNYGLQSVEIATIGIVVAAGRNDTLMVSSGTSFAAPVVAALAAVEGSYLTSWDWQYVKWALMKRLRVESNWQNRVKNGILKSVCD
jgi:Subtilase family